MGRTALLYHLSRGPTSGSSRTGRFATQRFFARAVCWWSNYLLTVHPTPLFGYNSSYSDNHEQQQQQQQQRQFPVQHEQCRHHHESGGEILRRASGHQPDAHHVAGRVLQPCAVDGLWAPVVVCRPSSATSTRSWPRWHGGCRGGATLIHDDAFPCFHRRFAGAGDPGDACCSVVWRYPGLFRNYTSNVWAGNTII